MRLSAFTRCGHLRCSSKPARTELIYRAIVSSQGGNFALDGNLAARWFANAMAIGRARATLERAANQAEPLKCRDSLPKWESAYGITPGATDTLEQRRTVLDSRFKFRKGAVKTSVSAALRAALGSDFWAYRISTLAPSAGLIPSATPGSGPGTFKPDITPPRNFKLRDGISTKLGQSQQFVYSYHSGDTTQPVVGDTAVLDPGKVGSQEQVTISYADGAWLGFTPTKPHAAGALLAFGPFPYWLSIHKHALVVVSPGIGSKPDTRRKVNDVMLRMATGISTWDIVEPMAPGVVRQFTVSTSQPMVGMTAIGLCNFVDEM